MYAIVVTSSEHQTPTVKTLPTNYSIGQAVKALERFAKECFASREATSRQTWHLYAAHREGQPFRWRLERFNLPGKHEEFSLARMMGEYS